MTYYCVLLNMLLCNKSQVTCIILSEINFFRSVNLKQSANYEYLYGQRSHMMTLQASVRFVPKYVRSVHLSVWFHG
jgi:hypothetical protein